MNLYSRIRDALTFTPPPTVLTVVDTPLGSWQDSGSGSDLLKSLGTKPESGISSHAPVREEFVQIPIGIDQWSSGLLYLPDQCLGAIVLTHDPITGVHSGSNRVIARMLHHMGFGTLLMDVNASSDENPDAFNKPGHNAEVFSNRLVSATSWLSKHPYAEGLRFGIVGAGPAAESALIASVKRPDLASAIVGIGWHPDLLSVEVAEVTAPTLLIAGGGDAELARLNTRVLTMFPGEKDLELIPGATHQFDAPGTIEAAAIRTGKWFERHLVRAVASSRPEMLASAAWP